jgi:hypothetical protein
MFQKDADPARLFADLAWHKPVKSRVTMSAEDNLSILTQHLVYKYIQDTVRLIAQDKLSCLCQRVLFIQFAFMKLTS